MGQGEGHCTASDAARLIAPYLGRTPESIRAQISNGTLKSHHLIEFDFVPTVRGNSLVRRVRLQSVKNYIAQLNTSAPPDDKRPSDGAPPSNAEPQRDLEAELDELRIQLDRLTKEHQASVQSRTATLQAVGEHLINLANLSRAES